MLFSIRPAGADHGILARNLQRYVCILQDLQFTLYPEVDILSFSNKFSRKHYLIAGDINMSKIKQSLCIPCYKPDGMNINDFCATVAEMGFKAVEIWFRDESFGELIEAVRRNGLQLASMAGHKTLNDGLNKRENHDRIESEFIESIDMAAEYDVPGLICFSGNRNEGQSDSEGLSVCVEGIKRVIGYAEEKGVNLNMELLNSKINHPGYQCDHSEWGFELCRRVDSPRMKLLYDIYHMQIMEGDVIRTIKENIEYIGHFHTAGNPGRNELDDTQELNYSGICRAIAGTGYDLYLAHEFTPAAKNWQAALQEAFEICDI